jgi:glycosyltransferase involved in cell wall biosynthesis
MRPLERPDRGLAASRAGTVISPRRHAVLLVGDTLSMGGTERQFTEIARGLASSRWDVHVSCLRAEGPLRARLEEAGIQPWSCGEGSLKSPVLLRGIWRLARYIRSHGIRLVHSFDFYSNVYGVLAGRLAATGTIIASQRDLGDLRPALECRINRVMLRLAHYVLANSEAAADSLRRRGAVRPERLVVIPNGLDTARFTPLARSADHGRLRVFGTVANLRPEKGLADLVRAAAFLRDRYPDLRVVIWGEGPLRPNLEALVTSLGLDGLVQFPGHAHRAEEALLAMDAFVLPSLSESCSNSLMEAMAVGLPVIASNAGGNPELVVDGGSGVLVPPGEPARLAQAMARLMDNPAAAAALGAHAAQRIRTEFTLSKMLAGVEALYASALSRGETRKLPEAPGKAA